jgi:hypothetical protein
VIRFVRIVVLAGLTLVAACEGDETPDPGPNFSACDAAVVPLDSVPDRFVHPEFAIMTPKALGDSLQAMDHCIVVDAENRLHCFWTRGWGWKSGLTFGHASSMDLVSWELHPSIELRADTHPIDRQWAPQVFWADGRWEMYFTGVDTIPNPQLNEQRIFRATSVDLFDWSSATVALEPRHPETAWGTGIPFANDARDQIVFRSGGRLLMLLTIRLPHGDQSLALAEQVDDAWTVIDVLETIRGEVVESPYVYAVDGQPRILINNWKDGGQALWVSDSLGGTWTRDPADLRGFAWELMKLDGDYVMASRVWGSSVMLTNIDLEDLNAVNMVFPECYTGSAPLLPALTPVWEVELR